MKINESNIDSFINLMTQGQAMRNDIKSFTDMGRATNGIKARARDLVLQYPVLISSALSQETVAAVTRSLEHEYANLLVLLINDANIQGGPSTGDYLKGFHNNVLEAGNLPSSFIKNANLELLNETSDVLFNKESLNDLTINNTKMRLYNEAKNTKKSKTEREIDNINKQKAELERDRAALERDRAGLDVAATKARGDKDRLDALSRRNVELTNNDVRKLNDMSPTIIKGNITVTPAGAAVPIDKPLHFGVKAVAHLLDSDEIITNLSNNIGDPTLLVKFIEWTSGEKRLFTDLILQKDDMKALASSKGRGSHWFRKLTLMANNAKMRKGWSAIAKRLPFGQRLASVISDRVPIPTMPLVISKSEVEQIRSKTGIDLLRNEGDIRNLMDKLYLLTFIIVDDTTEMVYIYDEVSKRYVSYSTKQLKGFAKDDLLTPEQAMKRSLMR